MKRNVKKMLSLLSIITLVNASLPYQAFAEIKDNVGGMDTTGTVSADKILAGETGWVNGEQITGTMPNRAATNIPVSSGGTYDIAKGYYNGSGKVTNDISSITGALNNLGTAANDKFDLSSQLKIDYAGTSTYSALAAGLNSATTAIKNIADKDASKITINQGGQKAIVDGYYHNNSVIENDISNVVGSVNALNSKVNDTLKLSDSDALSTTYADNLTYTDLSGAIDETASAIENNKLGNVYNLGTGYKFNIKELYPNIDYQKLTTDNFIVGLSSIPSASQGGGYQGHDSFTFVEIAGCSVIKNYNPETGLLTIAGNTISATGGTTGNWSLVQYIDLPQEIYDSYESYDDFYADWGWIEDQGYVLRQAASTYNISAYCSSVGKTFAYLVDGNIL